MKFRITIQSKSVHERDVERLEALGFLLERRRGLLYGYTHRVLNTKAVFIALETLEQLIQFVRDNGQVLLIPANDTCAVPTLHIVNDYLDHIECP